VRSSLPSQALADTMREAVWSVDKNLPVYEMKTLDQYLGLATAQQRFNALVLGLFAMLAVVLSMVGLYGVVSYSVGQRTHEFGVRIALGAKHSELMSMVLRQGLSLVIVGIALGLVGASALTRFLSSLLYQVHPTDPPTFIAITALLAGVALLACYTPARRATKADPMVALRYE